MYSLKILQNIIMEKLNLNLILSVLGCAWLLQRHHGKVWRIWPDGCWNLQVNLQTCISGETWRKTWCFDCQTQECWENFRNYSYVQNLNCVSIGHISSFSAIYCILMLIYLFCDGKSEDNLGQVNWLIRMKKYEKLLLITL